MIDQRAKAYMSLTMLERTLAMVLPATKLLGYLNSREREAFDQDLANLAGIRAGFDNYFPDVPSSEELQKLLSQVETEAYARGHREGVENAKRADEMSSAPSLDEDMPDINEGPTRQDFAPALAKALRPFALQEEVTDLDLDEATAIYASYVDFHGVPK